MMTRRPMRSASLQPTARAIAVAVYLLVGQNQVTMTRMPKHKLQPPASSAPTAAARAILDAAERLAQTRGYNGFSYADVAAQIGVTKASLHYHFPSKAELGRALIERYHVGFTEALGTIDREVGEPCGKLERYVALYDAVMRNA